MVRISNIKVYDLVESILACRNSMRIEPREDLEPSQAYAVEMESKDFVDSLARAVKLCTNPVNSGEINFLKGIRVSFDIVYPQYFTPELQRYVFIDIISSSSKMHRLSAITEKGGFNKYTDPRSIGVLQELLDAYNNEKSYENFMRALSSCPLGIELFMRVSTNYACLRNIWIQRHNHRLKEDWGAFCEMIEGLPYFNEFIKHQNHTI